MLRCAPSQPCLLHLSFSPTLPMLATGTLSGNVILQRIDRNAPLASSLQTTVHKPSV